VGLIINSPLAASDPLKRTFGFDCIPVPLLRLGWHSFASFDQIKPIL
jgi:hypothetical protein